MKQDLESLCAGFPLTKEQSTKMEEHMATSYARMAILDKMMKILKKSPTTLEEAAMLFNQAKPLAEMFIDVSSKK